jgi:hypothetical protein
VAFKENGIAFAADLVAGQKTGFFLDQRDNRSWMQVGSSWICYLVALNPHTVCKRSIATYLFYLHFLTVVDATYCHKGLTCEVDGFIDFDTAPVSERCEVVDA